MSFIKNLVETEDSIKLKEVAFGSYEDTGFRLFKHLQISESVNLSIQASYGHYCFPRKTLPKTEYVSMEIAILKDGEFVSVNEVTDNEVLINAFNEYYEGTVYANVPIGLIEGLYQELT